jgi:predicted site-specific integrase-resolvase
LTNCNLNGLQTISNEIETQLGIYLKPFVILYTVLMAESSADLQNQLNSFQDYCSIWKLKVNTPAIDCFALLKLPVLDNSIPK